MIRPFASADEMVTHHIMMYGSLGQMAAEAVLRWAPLWPGLNALDFRIVFAPIELGPYGRHIGYTVTRREAHAPRYIIANRNVCRWLNDGSMTAACDHQFMIDFIVHEMTHHRQRDLILRDGIRQNRGSKKNPAKHHDAGWYGAIAEAAPAYLGVAFPPERWPKQKSQGGRLTDEETTYWPHTFRELIARRDARLSLVDETDNADAFSSRAEQNRIEVTDAVGQDHSGDVRPGLR